MRAPAFSASRLSRREMLSGLAGGVVALAMLREDALARVQDSQSRHAGKPIDELARDEDFWFGIQQAFAVDRSVINLNNGGVSPSPRVVMEAHRRHLEFANGLPARNLWQIQDPQVESVRAHLAAAFGCRPSEMAITRNASESLETCLFGIDLKAGDEVLTTELDYPRMLNTCRQRAAREGVVLKMVPAPAPADDPAQLAAVFEKNISEKTKLMLCSHVCFLTGQIFPVRDICRIGRQHGIPVIVDGAHAFGHLVFRRDDLECDYYGTSLHKWLTAPLGSGFLSVRESKIESLWPLMAAPEDKRKDIRKFEEIGTHPAANRLAIAEALTFYDAIGPQRKEARLRYLRDYWAKPLAEDGRVRFYTKLDHLHSCAITTIAIDGLEPPKLVEHLWTKHRIFVVAIDTVNVKGVRVTPNVYTTTEELDTFVAAMKTVLTSGL
ncbi:MAG: aminotransferase class V-fold PLP-dependent enzyme [Phycisphaerae bacterium]